MKFDREISNSSSLNADTLSLNNYDVIFDLNADDTIASLKKYVSLENKLIIVCAVKKSLSTMFHESSKPMKSLVAGMNLLPTFINRSKLEVCFHDKQDRRHFEKFFTEMKLDFLEVEDHAGMVTPRVVFMIINEACYSLHEGVASIIDIDKAMK